MSRARTWARRAAGSVGGGVVTGYAALCVGFWWYQEALVFQPPAWADAASLHEVARGRGTDELALRADDGTALLAWRQRAGADRLVLFLSGNGEALSDYLPFHDLVVAEGFDLLTVAYRGYPGSAAVAPSQRGLAADARAAWDWATGPGGYPPDRIVVHGRSLGGGVAAELVAGGARPAALVLESTFARLSWVLSGAAPGLPYGLLLRHPFDTRAHGDALQVPTLILAAAGDALIPPEVGGRALAAVIPGASYVEVEGLSHQHDLPVSSGAAREAWTTFVQSRVPAGG